MTRCVCACVIDESDENRILIRQLIQRWTRPMLGLGSSHREFLQERDRAFEANDLELQQKLIAVKPTPGMDYFCTVMCPLFIDCRS